MSIVDKMAEAIEVSFMKPFVDAIIDGTNAAISKMEE